MSERFRVALASDADAADWDSLVSRVSESTPFHLWNFSKSLTSSYGYEFYGLMALKDNQIQGILPIVRVRSLFFGDRLISIPFADYGGPVGAASAFPILIDAARRLAPQLGVKEIQLRDSTCDVHDIDTQFSKISRYVTFEVKLDNDLDSRIGRKTRNTIRRAERSSAEIREMLPSDLPAFYRVYLQTQKRLGSPPHSLALFESLFSRLSAQGVAKFLAAEIDGTLLAAVVLFCHKQELFWWNSVVETRQLRKNLTTLLLWKTANWAIRNGFSKLNMGRTRPYTSVYDFKSHWGGREAPLSEYVAVAHGGATMVDPEQLRFRLLSAVWSRLPISLQRRLGPRIVRGIAL